MANFSWRRSFITVLCFSKAALAMIIEWKWRENSYRGIFIGNQISDRITQLEVDNKK